MEERKSRRRSTSASMKPVERARMSFMDMRWVVIRMGGCGACLVLVLGLMARLSGKVQLSCRNLGVISGAAAGRVMANSDSAVALCSPLKLAHSNSRASTTSEVPYVHFTHFHIFCYPFFPSHPHAYHSIGSPQVYPCPICVKLPILDTPQNDNRGVPATYTEQKCGARKAFASARSARYYFV